MSSVINLVWLKRDLRSQNHAALHAAESNHLPYRVIYIFDTTLINHSDTSLRHLQFVYHSLLDLNKTLLPYQREVEIFYGKSEEVFKYLIHENKINTIFSYEETGVQLSWERDKMIMKLLKHHKIKWQEFPTNGIIRGITNRDGWDKKWYVTMSQPIIKNTYSKNHLKPLKHSFSLPKDFKEKLKDYPKHFQPAGETNAWKYLTSFLKERGFSYHYHISKPQESRMACSRISTYLAWGNLSIHQAVQFAKNHPNFGSHKRAFTAFLSRLKWHCHFIQKFEVECAYETHCINRGYELLERENNINFLQAWKEGKTGFPLVDACMRAVKNTGWINFRMRAMLVSVLCHHFDMDWRKGVYHLAQQFLDYEPGIHYPQFQMQAGTTGVNTIRMYNPIKQSQDHDPEGKFIKKWIPELANVATAHIHEPWKMTQMEQEFCGVIIGKHYPNPIVDLTERGKFARDKIWGHRKHKVVQKENERILKTHTRRG